MKRFLIAAAICVVVAAALLLFYPPGQPAASTENPAAQDSAGNSSTTPNAGSRPTSASASSPDATTVGSGQSSSPGSFPAQPQNLSARAGQYVPPTNAADLNLPPETVLQNVRRAVRQYGQMFGGNPVGTNPEITAALTGQNPKKINFIAGADGMRVNDQGELIDLWGTPYFFHQISGDEMEIHSAGPDKKMWTSDDIVTR